MARNFVSWPVREDQTLADLPTNTTYQLYKTTVDELFPDASDQRLQAFFYDWGTPHVVDGEDYALMNKFRVAIMDPDQIAPGQKSYRTVDADYVYWRLADIYLLRAECYQKLHNDANAIVDLNRIRTRAGALTYPSIYDTEGLKKAIFREREKEFIGENDARYADIIRNGYVKDELQGKLNCSPIVKFRMVHSSYRCQKMLGKIKMDISLTTGCAKNPIGRRIINNE